jgi:hypothetical protein
MPAPSVQQERRAQLEAEANEQTPEQVAEAERLERERIAANDNPPNNEPRVTISREEFNELQAAKDRLAAAERRTDAVRGDLEALQSRLTELEEAAKGSGQGAAPASSGAVVIPADASQIPLTDKEKADFEEDTIALMEKIAENVYRRNFARDSAKISESIGEARQAADNATKTVGKVSNNQYTERVAAEVAKFSDFQTIVSHPHWAAFTQAEDDISGQSYAQLIQHNLNTNKVQPMVNIFKKFYDKYLKDEPNTDGYAGGVPTGSNNVDTGAPNGNKPKMLKYSDRQKAQQDYLAQPRRISYDDYQAVKKEFDEADREGRVDYNA